MSCLQNEVAILENKLSDAHQQNAHLSKEIAIKDRLTEHLEAEIEAAQGENDKILAREQLLKAETGLRRKISDSRNWFVTNYLFVSVVELHTR